MSRPYVPAELRRLVFKRARGCCEYCRCQVRYSPGSFHIEHIHPVELGGATSAENLALACQGCNSHEYTKTIAHDPATALPVALFHPREQNWADHFGWNEDCSLVLGLTPSGRATVIALQLNRERVVNLRRVLYQAHEHPPEILLAEILPEL
ncbi:MAG: HNH endonuclease [Acidobacteria bacterium]|nr:HNH endonuclease [Acidobacteriota bacterium]